MEKEAPHARPVFMASWAKWLPVAGAVSVGFVFGAPGILQGHHRQNSPWKQAEQRWDSRSSTLLSVLHLGHFQRPESRFPLRPPRAHQLLLLLGLLPLRLLPSLSLFLSRAWP